MPGVCAGEPAHWITRLLGDRQRLDDRRERGLVLPGLVAEAEQRDHLLLRAAVQEAQTLPDHLRRQGRALQVLHALRLDAEPLGLLAQLDVGLRIEVLDDDPAPPLLDELVEDVAQGAPPLAVDRRELVVGAEVSLDPQPFVDAVEDALGRRGQGEQAVRGQVDAQPVARRQEDQHRRDREQQDQVEEQAEHVALGATDLGGLRRAHPRSLRPRRTSAFRCRKNPQKTA
jgi:hypothetical protein